MESRGAAETLQSARSLDREFLGHFLLTTRYFDEDSGTEF